MNTKNHDEHYGFTYRILLCAICENLRALCGKKTKPKAHFFVGSYSEKKLLTHAIAKFWKN